jgi:hypothetical protein
LKQLLSIGANRLQCGTGALAWLRFCWPSGFMRRLRLTALIAHTALLHAWAILIAFYLGGWKAVAVTALLPVASWLGLIWQYAADSRAVILFGCAVAFCFICWGLVLVAERAARSR